MARRAAVTEEVGGGEDNRTRTSISSSGQSVWVARIWRRYVHVVSR